MSRASRPGGRVILNGIATPTIVGYGDGSPSWGTLRPDRRSVSHGVKVPMIMCLPNRSQVTLDVAISWLRAPEGITSEVVYLDPSSSDLVSAEGDVVKIRMA